MYISDEEVIDYTSALKSDKDRFLNFQRELMSRGVFLPPSQFECNFISTAHSDDDLDKTLEKVEESLRKVA
jgi:glutamate-1-semialdehyde 2,1-aminomutase